MFIINIKFGRIKIKFVRNKSTSCFMTWHQLGSSIIFTLSIFHNLPIIFFHEGPQSGLTKSETDQTDQIKLLIFGKTKTFFICSGSNMQVSGSKVPGLTNTDLILVKLWPLMLSIYI